MLSGRLQVLADGQDVAVDRSEIAHHFSDFVLRLPHSYDQPGLLRDNYYPGDIGFDPLGLKPEDPEELNMMITKDLQNGRLAMLAAAGFLAQEAVDGKGILEHFSS